MAQKKGRLKIVIDIEDWHKEYRRENPDLSSEEAAIRAQMERGYLSTQMARLLIVDREIAEGERTIVPPNKTLFLMGTAEAWLKVLKRQTVEVTTPGGETYKVRAIIGSVESFRDREFAFEVTTIGEDDVGERPAPPVWIHSPKALELARKYVLNIVPRHIWSRLLIILHGKGDVREVAEALKDRIDDMVAKLV